MLPTHRPDTQGEQILARHQDVDLRTKLVGVAKDARDWIAPACIVVCGAFAFRLLIDYAPYTGIERVSDETESMFFSPNQSSPGLIFGVAAWLFLGRRHQLRAAIGSAASFAWAGVFLALASAVYVWAWYVSAADLTVVSLIFSILGAGALLGGAAGLRAVWLPAIFLIMLIPVPAVLINEVVFELQLFTAHFTVAVLNAVGISATELGDLMFARGRVFQVIESCAGLRMIDTLTMSAVLYAELFYHSRLQAVLLVVLAPLIGLFVNQVRVLSIVLSPESQLSEGHTAQGIVMVVAGVLLIAAVDALLTRVLPAPTRPAFPKRVPTTGFAGSVPARTGIASALLIVLGLTPMWLEPWQRELPPGRPLFEFKPLIEGWQAGGIKLDRQFMGTAGFSQYIHRSYTRGEDEVELLLASDDRLRRRVSLRSDKAGWPGSGFRILNQTSNEIAPGIDARIIVLDSPKGPVVAYSWYQDVESLGVEILRSLLALDQSPFRRPERGLVVRLNTKAAPTQSGLVAAEARLQSFLPIVIEEIARLQNP